MTAPLNAFRVVAAADVAAAVAAYHSQPDSRYLAGGTDLLVNMRRGLATPSLLVDLGAVGELREWASTASGTRIGTGVRIAELAASQALRARYPALIQAANGIAGPAHRSMATVGGNLCLDTRCIYYNQSDWWRGANGYCLKYRGDVCHVAPQGEHCHAAFSGDLAPALLVLGAEIEVADQLSRRRMPLAALYQEDGRAHLTLAAGDLVVSVLLPADASASAYAKVRVRGAVDFPLAGVAVALRIRDGRLVQLQVAMTGTNSRPLLLAGTEALLDQPLDDAALARLDKLVQKQVQPMRTTIAQGHYRRQAAGALARRLAAALAAAESVP